MVKILTKTIVKRTKGAPDLIDISSDVDMEIENSGLREGSILLFVVGSTAALTTFEYEPGLVHDMEGLYERIAPRGPSYAHDETRGDANGFSHVRAALQGPSITIPFKDGKMLTGTWQQIVLAEFDNRPRERKVIVQLTGV